MALTVIRALVYLSDMILLSFAEGERCNRQNITVKKGGGGAEHV